MFPFGIGRRLDDHMAAERERNQVQQDQHRELREQVKSLSDQTRAEFSALRTESMEKHRENRSLLRMIAAGLIIAVVTWWLNKNGLAGAH